MKSPQSLLRTGQAQLSQPLFVGEVLQHSVHLRSPPLGHLQQLHILLVLGPRTGQNWEERGSSALGLKLLSSLVRALVVSDNFVPFLVNTNIVGCRKRLSGQCIVCWCRTRVLRSAGTCALTLAKLIFFLLPVPWNTSSSQLQPASLVSLYSHTVVVRLKQLLHRFDPCSSLDLLSLLQSQ